MRGQSSLPRPASDPRVSGDPAVGLSNPRLAGASGGTDAPLFLKRADPAGVPAEGNDAGAWRYRMSLTPTVPHMRSASAMPESVSISSTPPSGF
jgi:hypothetical protein